MSYVFDVADPYSLFFFQCATWCISLVGPFHFLAPFISLNEDSIGGAYEEKKLDFDNFANEFIRFYFL